MSVLPNLKILNFHDKYCTMIGYPTLLTKIACIQQWHSFVTIIIYFSCVCHSSKGKYNFYKPVSSLLNYLCVTLVVNHPESILSFQFLFFHLSLFVPPVTSIVRPTIKCATLETLIFYQPTN